MSINRFICSKFITSKSCLGGIFIPKNLNKLEKIEKVTNKNGYLFFCLGGVYEVINFVRAKKI